jgi:hypothetical protein
MFLCYIFTIFLYLQDAKNLNMLFNVYLILLIIIPSSLAIEWKKLVTILTADHDRGPR